MKKLFTLMFCIVFLIGIISAFSTNKVGYSDKELRVDFKSNFGIPLISEDIGSAELKSHKSVTEIKEVCLNSEVEGDVNPCAVSMYYDFDFKEVYRNGLGEVYFTDKENNKVTERAWRYVYWGDVEVEDYGNKIVGHSENGTAIYESVKIGSHTEKKWLPYNSKDIPEKSIRIGIEVEVSKGDYIDGVWEIAGKKVTKHAFWQESYNAGIDAVYKLDLSSGGVVDSTGNVTNGTNNGTTRGVTGQVGNAFDFEADELDNVDLGTGFVASEILDYTGDFSIIAWIKLESAHTGVIVGKRPDVANYQYVFRYETNHLSLLTTSGDHDDDVALSVGDWAFVGVTFDDDGNVTFYVNGSSTTNHTSKSITHKNGDVTLGQAGVGYPSQNFDGFIDEPYFYGRVLSPSEIADIYAVQLSGRGYGDYFTDQSPVVTLNSPIDYYNKSSVGNIVLNCTAYDDSNLTNNTLYIDGILNQTNSSGINNSDYIFTKYFADGEYNWTCGACDNSSQCTNASVRYFEVDSISPNITIIYPINSTTYTDNYTASSTIDIDLNWTTSDSNIDTCWYFNGTANNTIACGSNATITLPYGEHNFKVYANDTFGFEAEESVTSIWTYRILENSQTYNTSSYETAREGFSINLTANSSLSSVKLMYNGTEYSTTKSGNIYSKSVDVSGTGNKTFYWKFTYSGYTITSPDVNQSLGGIVLGLCNATLNQTFVNYTFKNEDDLSATTGQFSLSSFEYYLGSGSVNKTYTYTNNTNNTNYAFCFSPSDRTINIDQYIQYKNDASPQRIYDPTTTTLTNSTTNHTLYLLETADGLYVTFQVVNSGQQTISGVYVNTTRQIGGETVLVGQGTTGESGSVTFWLNPDYEYTFSFSKTGYNTYTYSDTPTQTSYTVTLSGGTNIPDSYSRGISTYLLPRNTSLVNGTTYTFGFQLNSSYWDIDEYGFNLRLSNGTIITGGSTGTEATLLTKDYNTGNQSRIYLDYYWIVSGNYTNVSVYWNVYNTANTQWSIKTFFTDLSLYMDSGLFGIDNFGRKLFIFLIIFISVGTLGYKYGANDPIFVGAIVFGVIFFFDVAVGLTPSYTTSGGREIEHLYTFVSGLILALLSMREVTR